MARNTGILFEVGLENFISIFMYGMETAVSVLVVVLYISRGRMRQKLDEKLVHYGFAGFMICMSYYGLIPNFVGENDLLSLLLIKLGSISLIGAFTCLIAPFEYQVKKTKFIITILNLISIVLILLQPLDYERYYPIQQYILVLDFTAVMVFLYLFTKWSALELKVISSFMTFGFLGIGAGMEISLIPVEMRTPVVVLLMHSMHLIGFVFLIIPLVFNPEKISNVKQFWTGLGFASLAISLFAVTFTLLIYFNLPGLIIAILVISVLILTLRLIFNAYKTGIPSNLPFQSQKQDRLKVLEMFMRPKSLTDEEISVAKEQRICLVCKNKIIGINYQCPGCDSLYCINCSTALSDAENLCWVCNTPFDENKPYNDFETNAKEIVTLDHKTQKNK